MSIFIILYNISYISRSCLLYIVRYHGLRSQCGHYVTLFQSSATVLSGVWQVRRATLYRRVTLDYITALAIGSDGSDLTSQAGQTELVEIGPRANS